METEGVQVRVVRPGTLVLAWVLLVAGVAGASWFAVGAAGAEVGAPVAAADVVLPAPVAASRTRSPTPGSSGTPSATTSPRGRPSASPSPTPPPGRRGIQPSPGGSLVVYCEGTGVEHWAVRPADGWLGEDSQPSASEVEATFQAVDGRTFVVHATCHASGPTFSTHPG